MDIEPIVAVAGSLASIVGVGMAIIQTIRYRSIKRTRKMQIWGNIALALEAFDRLEPLRDTLDKLSIPDEVKVRLIAARQSVVDQYLRLLEQAALAEDNFTTETVDRWYRNGRLQTEWRRQAAMNFVPTEDLPRKTDPPQPNAIHER